MISNVNKRTLFLIDKLYRFGHAAQHTKNFSFIQIINKNELKITLERNLCYCDSWGRQTQCF